MMLYYQTKSGCKWTSCLEDRLEQKLSYFDYISPHCDLDIEDSEPIFLLDTLACDAALPYQVWHQNDLQFRKYHPDKHSPTV